METVAPKGLIKPLASDPWKLVELLLRACGGRVVLPRRIYEKHGATASFPGVVALDNDFDTDALVFVIKESSQ